MKKNLERKQLLGQNHGIFFQLQHSDFNFLLGGIYPPTAFVPFPLSFPALCGWIFALEKTQAK